VTVTVPAPPGCGRFALEGEIENAHPPSWFTVTIFAAIVAVPLRAGPLFAAMPSCTVPFPAPLAAPEIEIHGALLVEFHEQSPAVATWTFCGPPAAAAAIESGDTVAVQPAS